MEGEKPQHGQHQPEEEAVRDAAADGAAESAQAHPMEDDDVAVLMEDGTGRSDLDLDAVAREDEAMAHALHMEELMQVEDWDLRRFEFEEPAPAGAHGPAVFHAAPAGQAINLQFAEGQPIFDGTAFVQIDAIGTAVAPPAGGVGMQELVADHAAEGL